MSTSQGCWSLQGGEPFIQYSYIQLTAVQTPVPRLR